MNSKYIHMYVSDMKYNENIVKKNNLSIEIWPAKIYKGYQIPWSQSFKPL